VSNDTPQPEDFEGLPPQDADDLAAYYATQRLLDDDDEEGGDS